MSFIAEYELDNPIVRETRLATDGVEFVVEDEHLTEDGDGHLVVWAYGDDANLTGLNDALDHDSSLDDWERLATLDGSRLYRIEPSDGGTVGMTYRPAIDLGITFLDIRSSGDRVEYRAQIPSREIFATYRDVCRERDLHFRLRSLYRGEPGSDGTFGTTPRQREVLRRALAAGYFDVPRETTLEELAADLDVSGQALSALLRRGQANVLRHTIATDAGERRGTPDQSG